MSERSDLDVTVPCPPRSGGPVTGAALGRLGLMLLQNRVVHQ
jgi:hypothetical protein